MAAENATFSSPRRTFLAGIFRENPTLVLLVGMCPPLAVTTALKPALTMGLSVIFVLVGSNLVVSLMRKMLRPHVRMLMFTVTIAAFVTVADLFLQAFSPEMSAKLGAYIPLIIVNCIIIFRAEACASKCGPWISILDGLGMGIGFTLAMCLLGTVREVFATGCILGIPVLRTTAAGGWFTPWAAMSMPCGAFITLGLILALVSQLTRKK